MTLQIVTANRLRDGRVVYLTPGEGWSKDVNAARVAEDKDQAARLMTAAERAVAYRAVVAPYLIEVTCEGGTVRPVRFRERIRAAGPSIVETGHPGQEAAA